MDDVFAEKFWARALVMDSGCWEWQAYVMRNGYGQVGYNKRVLYTHRVAWELAFGDPGEGYVLHRCDNRKCVNPEHLFLGTFQDNMDDMVSKGRHAHGKRNGHVKLTEDQVKEIRSSEETGRALAKRFGVSEATVSMAKHRKNWAHL
jgi:hypothetical protein